MNINELVETYVKTRDAKSAKKAEFDAVLAKYDAVLNKIEEKLLAHFNDTGSDSVSVRGVGTAYTTVRTSASVADRDTFLGFVKDHEAWELLESRASKKAVEDYIAANDELPPGINMSRQIVVNVRRS